MTDILHLRYESTGLTGFAQAMPHKYTVEGHAVAAYRAFYREEKYAIARWTRQQMPGWWMSHAA